MSIVTVLRPLLLAVLCVAGAGASSAATPDHKPFVMLISIDGLKPEAVLEADSYGLKVPNLRALMRDGSYASGVHGVLPTLTYPSHMTLLTGASPAHHGILSNKTFDPLRRNQQGWYWYAEDVRVPTLWDAAAAAHLTTANIYWPTSVGAHIRWNLPQIWRAGTDDDLKLQRALGTPGLEQAMEAQLGRYPGGAEETVAEDEIRMRFALRLLETRQPDFMTVYMTGLDTEQHASGPFSEASNAVLERIDAQIGLLRAAAERAAPGRASICLVSDHGFAHIDHDVNLYSAFLTAGLFQADAAGKVTDWSAEPWPAGGGAAIMLANNTDESLRTRVHDLLTSLAADPANGIERILTHQDLAAAGAFPDAVYFIAFRSGFEMGDKFTGPLISDPTNRGMHGYPPDNPDMRSSFFLIGPGIPAGRSLGEIDMRRIAPTVAAILHLRLSGAELPALPIP